MGEEVTRRLRIIGRVQGVGYRAWCVGEANRLGLSGWARNRRDGSVEVLVCGPDPAVVELTERCQEGPRLAAVTSVDVEPSAPESALSGAFSQEATV